MELSSVRTHIIQGNFEKAFTELNLSTPPDKLNDVQLLWAQYNQWHRENLLISGAKPEERNRILYATLSIVSEIESRNTTGILAHRFRSIQSLEMSIAQGYSRLAEIRKKNIIDHFLMWMIQYHQPTLDEIIRQENAFGRTSNLEMLLKGVNLGQFIQINGLKSKPDDAVRYFLKKNLENERFFSGWLEYRSRQEKFEIAYENEIERCEKQHTKLLSAGLIGGVLGALSVEILSGNMNKIIENHDIGLDPPIELNDNYNTDDDSDDD